MNRKTKRIACGGTVALALLVVVSAPHIGHEPAPQPHVRPVPKGQTLSDFTQEDRAIPPPGPPPTFVGEETTNVEPDSTPATEVDFEPPKPSDRPAISTSKEPLRGNPTPKPSLPQTAATVTATEPQMGDTRIVDGQKQVHFLGFGWIEDNDTPNESVYAEDMYENGNKIGSMGGGEVGRSCGDIKKMVGTMD